MGAVKEVYVYLGPYGEYVEKVFASRDSAREYIRPDMEKWWKLISKNDRVYAQTFIQKGFENALEETLDQNKFIVEE